ncbi:MAG: hypothetical protein H8E10_11425 [Desulfobacterales bacterium]|nr:hypothetical protein [Desulfobacterales bacterium]MBL7101186.1 hypothetical protein [Desulfobacteraceae bacterium]MBL7171720.1 hypothetical protein [Desulfobacteraceae bacterium]
MFSKKMIRFQGFFLFLCLLAIMVGKVFAAEYWVWVDATNMTMADGRTVPVWGFGLDRDNDFLTTGDYAVSVPGPTLRVDPGDNSLIIHLKNNLSEPVSLNILGQRLTNNSGPVWTNFPDDTQTWSGSRPKGNYTARVRSFAHETLPGEVGEYRWESFRSGTFLLQSGTNPAKQVQMGMYLPVVKDASQGSAYADVFYDEELVVVFHEIDPAIHQAIAAGTYGAVPGATITSSIDREPKYFLMNGMSYPSKGLLPINGKVYLFQGDRILIRFLNAGLNTHVPQLLGLHMTLWAEDGNRYRYPKEAYGFELDSGKTVDAILVSPMNPPWQYPLYDARLNLNNAGVSPGGMFSYISSSLPDHR